MTEIEYKHSFGTSAQPSAPDTAPRKTRAYNLTGSRTSAAEVEKMVKNDIDGNIYLAKTKDFLTRLFPVDTSVIDTVYETLVANRGYDIKEEEWTGLPKAEKKESLYYEPFVNIAESIRTAHRPPSGVTLSCAWVDRHGKAPKSRDQDASIIRPDVLCVLGMEKEQAEWEALMNDKEKNKQIKAITAWWLRVNVPVEIKPVESDDILKHIQQLLGYMRQVLREQADRRFVPGLLLSRTRLQVWFCDRSGVLGMRSAINIHKDPKNFIRIILACSLLPPERLGWDPTMKLCRQPINPQSLELIHSYDPSVTLSDYHDSLYDTHWVIEMPSKTDINKREQYITVRALSIVRTECMSGRATIVWAVLKVDDMRTKSPPHKIYVLKQCWRPTAGTNEGEFFGLELKTPDARLGRLHSYEDVQQDGKVIDTQNFIRQALDHFLPDADKVSIKGKRVNEALTAAEEREAYLDITLTSDKARVLECTREPNPTWRTFARMLFEDYGWPLNKFRDLLELTVVSKQLLVTHELLYFSGTLHRDISLGNMLICPINTDGTTEGRLIDLDYAKRTECFTPPLLHRAKDNKRAPSKKPKVLDMARAWFEHHFEVKPPDDDVVDACFSSGDGIQDFADAILDYNPGFQNPKISAYAIGLLEKTRKVPDFAERGAQNRQRSVTLPYASPEILTRVRIFPKTGHTVVIHNAVHDVEAMFWATTNLCITKGGPGGKRRDELKPGTQSTPETQELFLIVDCFFYSESITRLARNKHRLFLEDDFETHVLRHIHPYFEPLRPLLVKWWKILRIAHQFPMFEAIHDWFLDALGDTIAMLKKNPPEIHPGSADVDAFRRKDLESLRYFPRQDSEDQKSQGATWDSSPSKDTTSQSHDYLDNAAQPPPHDPASPTPARKAKKQRTSL